MSIQFPDTPTQGDSFTASNGVIYTYNNGGWMANSVSGLDDTYVNRTGDTMTGDLTLPNLSSEGDVQTTSLNGGQLAGFRNYFVNGDLTQWQRGASAYASGGSVFTYGSADRFGLFSDASGLSMGRSGTTNTPANGEFRYSISLATGGGYLGQRVELLVSNPFRAGTTWTVSVYTTQSLQFFCRDQESNVVFQSFEAMPDTQGPADANGFVRRSMTFTLPSGASTGIQSLECYFKNNGTDTARLTGFQLEPGPVATPFEHRPIGTELALCQRYFFKIDARFHFYPITPLDGTGRMVSLTYPSTLRAIPTLAFDSDNGGNPSVAFYGSGGTTGTTLQSSAAGTSAGRWLEGLSFDAEL